MRSAPLSPGRWRLPREDKQHRNGSRSSPTRKRPLDGWPRRRLALARCMCSGRESTSQCSARPDITIKIRWRSAHKGVPGNGKADERAKLAAEETDTRGVEWLKYGPTRGARTAVAQIARTLQAGDRGEEMSGGAVVGWRPDL